MLYSVASLLLMLTLMVPIPVVSDNKTMTEVLIYVNGILYATHFASFSIMSISMLAKCVPENVQTVTEAIRDSLFQLAYLISGLGVRLPDVYMKEFMLSLTVLLALAFAYLIVNAERFKNIQVLQIDNEDL